MAKSKTPPAQALVLTPEEEAIILKARQAGNTTEDSNERTSAHKELAEAFVEAIERTKPPTKKTSFNRPKNGPWEPKDGRPKPRLKRKMYQHGIELREETLSPLEIELLNKVKAGSYCGGFVKAIKRKDRGIDIDYPVRTASQRLKLSNQFGIVGFTGLLNRLIEEASKPELYKPLDEDDD